MTRDLTTDPSAANARLSAMLADPDDAGCDTGFDAWDDDLQSELAALRACLGRR